MSRTVPGFGTYVLEDSPFGYDPPPADTLRGQTNPASPKYEGRTQDLAVDANGRAQSLHPVDYGMQMSLFVQKRELKSNPTIGNELLTCQELGTSRQQAEVERIVRAAYPLSDYVTKGSVTLRRIDSDFRTATGALLVAVYYRNNLTGKDEVATNQWQQAS